MRTEPIAFTTAVMAPIMAETTVLRKDTMTPMIVVGLCLCKGTAVCVFQGRKKVDAKKVVAICVKWLFFIHICF